ncbi:MAG: protein kinase [Pyrinomonadaceae bacterium]|nr:protein kinase [Pyrinomonadaceae bacterium]
MSQTRWTKISEILETALQKKGAERSAYLTAVCGNDFTLRQEIESLLNHEHSDQSDVFENNKFDGFLAAENRTMNRRFQTNEKIGDYRVLGFIGQGGMGEVYHAVHEKLNRQVAVKVLGNNIGLDSSYKVRFLNEARVQASLQHPNIATLYDFQEVGNELLIFMELVDGESLDNLIGRNYFSVEESLKVFESIVEAIRYVHSNGIIHRDIKTDNVKINSKGVPKLLDFGIAKDPKSQTLTQVGGVIGTPNYLAPEQLEGRQATQQTDIWSLGVLLYKMLTNRVPFESDLIERLVYQILQGKYVAPELLNRAVPPAVSEIIHKCLAKDILQRYQTADEILFDVRQVLNDRYSGETFLKKNSSHFPFAKYGAIAGAVLLFFCLIGLGFWVVSEPSATPNNKTPIKSIDNQTKTNSADKNNDLPAIQADRKDTPRINSGGGRTIRIETINGSAEVWRGGQRIGSTPLDVEVMDGESLNLTLKKPGFADQDIKPELTAGKKVYSYTLAAK